MNMFLPWPAQEIAGWLPWEQATGFFLATFILEDVAAISAGCLLAAGAISWPVAFWSCFLGIWWGDAGLYTLARFGGRRWFERSRFRRYASKVAASERWFVDSSTTILIFSRCVPGARLPTYLAAGFLRLPVFRFLVVTGTAAFGWTLLVLWLASVLGSRLFQIFHSYRCVGLFLLGLTIITGVYRQLAHRDHAQPGEYEWLTKLKRWRQWEFWPPFIFYPPVLLHGLWLMLKYRGVMLPTVANPGIYSGGMVGESKASILAELARTSPEFTAPAGLIPSGTLDVRLVALEQEQTRLGLDFPFILKPELGQRGAGVKVIRTAWQAEAYLRTTNAPLVIQRYAPGPGEAGVFYYRLPHEKTGRIFSLTEKIFPTVTGDGHATLAELINRDPRASLIAGIYLKRLGKRSEEVLPLGETIKLVEAGNHAQGCIFRDGHRLITPELTAHIDAISQKLEGFYIGRYDLRYEKEDDLRTGRRFQIIELNGASAEATSIYDSRNSLWQAYRTLFRQWELVFAIGRANRARGAKPMGVLAFVQAWRAYLRLAKSYPIAD